MEQDQPDKPQIVIQAFDQPGGVHQIYSNHINLAWTGHDVQIRFNYTARLPEDMPSDVPASKVERRAEVTLAWSEAKLFLIDLGKVIAIYEKSNGEIKPPILP
jgi:hypothetical protein